MRILIERFYMTDQDLKYCFEKYGSPIYVFDTQELKTRVKDIAGIWGDKVKLCYSIKANPFLMKDMLEVVDKLEVCSPGELEICKNLNVQGEHIIFSGVNKTKEDIDAAVDHGCYVYTIESLKHAALLQKAAKSRNINIDVYIRLTSGSQFGLSKEDLFYILDNLSSYSNLNIMGLHYFVGTQRKKLSQQVDELHMLHDLYDEINSNYDIKLERLEYGPGLPVPYFEGEDFSDTLKPAKELAETLQWVTTWCDLTVEMGRFYTSSCGYYITKIVDIKSNKDNNYMLVDGGMNHVTYLGQIMGMKVPQIRHLKSVKETFAGDERSLTSGDYVLCGSLCTTADILVRQLHLEDASVGDILAFGNIGAYSVTEGIYMFLSRLMPKIVLFDGNDPSGEPVTRLVRDNVKSSDLNTMIN